MKLRTSLLAYASILFLASCSEESATTGTDSSYPLKNCVVSGEPLGSMGTPVIITHEGTEVRLCCKECIKDFKANPEKYLSKIK